MTVTVLSGPERRRRWTTAEKLRIVQESLAPDAIINEIARRYDIHPTNSMPGGSRRDGAFWLRQLGRERLARVDPISCRSRWPQAG